jgi:hypothetical protein
VSRLPIRVRVAAAFAVALALVLVGTGLFLYARLGDDLAAALDQDLRLRASDLSALVRDPNGSLAGEAHGALVERGESFAELVTPQGVVLDSTPPLGQHPARPRRPARRAARSVRRPALRARARRGARLPRVVRRAGACDRGRATRENRAETLRSLRTELLIAGPIALLLATGIGYLLAGSGLSHAPPRGDRVRRPPGERLPIPRTTSSSGWETLNAMLDRPRLRLSASADSWPRRATTAHAARAPARRARLRLHDAETPEERSEALRTASDETDRLVQLAGDLLLIASPTRARAADRADAGCGRARERPPPPLAAAGRAARL